MDDFDVSLETYRFEQYIALGFTGPQAEALAVATETERDSSGRTWTRALHWVRVQQALADGCDHDTAVMVFA